jgi:hypothetical protein
MRNTPNAVGIRYNIADGRFYVTDQNGTTRELNQAEINQNLDLKTTTDSKPVRINSRDYTQTSGSAIGFQVRPAQTVSGESVIGGEIIPRVNSGVALSGSITGLHTSAYLRGTAAGTVTGNVRSLQVELVTDDGGTRTVSGYVAAIRIRAAFSAGTVTGNMSPFRVEVAETQTNSQSWDALFELTGISPGVWNDNPATELNNPGGTVKGYIKVIVNSQPKYIALYDIGNLAD